MRSSLVSVIAVTACLLPSSAWAAEGGGSAGADQQDIQIQDIVVTAQRRSEKANDIPISISVTTGDQLSKKGITSTADLVKVVPGLIFTPSFANTPVYTLRGVGFYESALAASPAVSVYVDEVPLAFPVMTEFPPLDVARVEVLKGPQGTLYGQNSTGGAINYIAAKPGDHWEAGGELGFARFAAVDLSGYLSGPVTSTLGARLSFRTAQGGAWQRSVTRNDSLGDANQISARLLLDWAPTDRLTAVFSFSAAHDGSDTLAGQLIKIDPVNPARVAPGLSDSLVTRKDARLADWDAGKQFKLNDNLYQASARLDFEASDNLNLISISAYQRFTEDRLSDVDGTAHQLLAERDTGSIDSFSQELRATGHNGSLKWIVGGNYSTAKTAERNFFGNPEQSNTLIVPFLPPFKGVTSVSSNKIETYGIFANADIALTSRLSVTGGVRYTNSNNRYTNCAYDTDGSLSRIFSFLSSTFTGTSVTIPPLGCVTLNAATGLPAVTTSSLKQDNVSWRAAVNYKFDTGTLLYASVGRGYKSGGFPALVAANSAQLAPITQESLLAYEVGFKTPLFGRKVQLNAAAFYYDYDNKQLRGRINVVPFGLIEALVNIPKSRIWGIEADLTARPFRGLDVTLGGSYVNSRIREFTGFGYASPALENYAGSAFPNTPRWTGVGDVQYNWAAGQRHGLFVGLSSRFQSTTNATFFNETNVPVDPTYTIPSYVVLDARFGVAASDDSWRLQGWVHNLTNKYYIQGLFRGLDTTYRQAAKPITYGVTFSVKW